MGASCISGKNSNEKENIRPSRDNHKQLEIALNPKASPNTAKNIDIGNRNSPGSATKASDKENKQTSNAPKSSCTLCQERFDGKSHLPVMLCEQEHTICMACKDMLLATPVPRYRVCPWCKSTILEQFVRPNQQLAQTLGCQ